MRAERDSLEAENRALKHEAREFALRIQISKAKVRTRLDFCVSI